MSEQFFQELEIPKPSFNCGISGGTHGENTGRMIEKIEKIIINSELDYLLVYGDTDSTLAGALAASKLSIPVFHVEAGLRSFNKNQPEEINRVLTDHLSEICFTPTLNACENLLKEGVPENKIVHVGDVMEDMNIFFSDPSGFSPLYLYSQVSVQNNDPFHTLFYLRYKTVKHEFFFS